MGEENLDPKPSEEVPEKRELPEEDLEQIQGGVAALKGLAFEDKRK